jgi:hypothetical protein
MSTHRALAERFAQTLTDHDLDAFAELLAHHRTAEKQQSAPVARPLSSRTSGSLGRSEPPWQELSA